MKSKSVRRLLLNIAGILIFSAIATFTLILARGNRFDITSGQFVETGTIRISSQPEEVRVFLNEKQITLNEKRIEGVDPGEYQVRITDEGFTSWEGVVQVEPGFITDLAVKLFPVNQQLEKFTQTNIDKLAFNDGRNLVIYGVTDNPKGSEVGIWRETLISSSFLNLNNNSSRIKLANFGDKETFVTADNYMLMPSPSGERLLVSNNEFSKLHILSTDRLNDINEDDMLDIDFPIDSVEFLDNTNLLIASGNLLANYNVEADTTSLLYFSDQERPIYSVAGNTVYWLSSDRNTIKTFSNGTVSAIKLENIELPEMISSFRTASSGNVLIIAHEDNTTYIEVESSYIKTFGNQQFIESSPNGQFIVTEDKNGKLNFTETTISQVFGDITHNTEVSELTKADIADGDIDWSFGSNFFIYRDEAGDIVSLDSRGGNLIDLVANEDGRIRNGDFTLTSDSTALFIALQDGVDEDQRYNIYKLDFAATP